MDVQQFAPPPQAVPTHRARLLPGARGREQCNVSDSTLGLSFEPCGSPRLGTSTPTTNPNPFFFVRLTRRLSSSGYLEPASRALSQRHSHYRISLLEHALAPPSRLHRWHSRYLVGTTCAIPRLCFSPVHFLCLGTSPTSSSPLLTFQTKKKGHNERAVSFFGGVY